MTVQIFVVPMSSPTMIRSSVMGLLALGAVGAPLPLTLKLGFCKSLLYAHSHG
jgi:hypothetical protein